MHTQSIYIPDIELAKKKIKMKEKRAHSTHVEGGKNLRSEQAGKLPVSVDSKLQTNFNLQRERASGNVQLCPPFVEKLYRKNVKRLAHL